ncbi:uncharacterized protein LOC111623293 [Centruroides sculpturatus]|uniref:uncharacterized protein LOC111623293 n=1 Tax=Centruroides sculpturatus TaxID=218467 RepID=UPI000C6D7464|nr:uncharacterized protein LOC111623293 [Centruroides sculpturatus]
MLSVSIADRVRFKGKKGDVVTALPVTVEFAKFVRGDKTSRLANIDEWSKLNLGGFDSEQIASPSDLLHAVVALYDTCLPDLTAQVLYKTVCVEGSKTLFLLRDTSEILKEWENQIISSPSSRSREDSLGEINNNPLTGNDNRKSVNSIVTTTQDHDRSAASTPKYHSGDDDYSSTTISPVQDEWRPWSSRNRRSGEATPERNVFLNKNIPITAPLSDNGKTDGYSHAESPFSDIFSDSVDSESESDLEERRENTTVLCYLPPFDGHYPPLPGVHDWDKPESLTAMQDEIEKCDLEEKRENTTVLCYLPPFDGHYPPLPGVHDWDKPESLTAMQDEIEKWRQKSLESYQAQFTCLTRLQREVFRLHNLLRRQEATITFLKKENYILQARLSRGEFFKTFTYIFRRGPSICRDIRFSCINDDFSRGLETFLRSVASRRKESRIAQETYCLLPSHVGIEHKLIASATFHKNYKIPGVKVVHLSLLTVRKRYRKCGIGKYFLKRLKNPSQVGPYDALVVHAKNSSQNFFRKNGFTDDVILCSRFGDLEERRENTTVLCYLPPFDGHYPPLPGVHDWDKPESLTAMQDEIEKWRQKSLESYQAQFTCLTRLQREVFRLHNLLRRQEATITFLKKENYILQARLSRVERKSAQTLIEALEKEAADFERLCTLKLENLETT